MTTEVDFNFTACGSPFAPAAFFFFFFLSSEIKDTGKRRKKRICQTDFIYSRAVSELFLIGIPKANLG